MLEKAAEILKKDQGIRLETLTNREKAMVIDALRDRYLLKELLEVFHMAKSRKRPVISASSPMADTSFTSKTKEISPSAPISN